MSMFTIDDLIRVMRQCAGEAEGGGLSTDISRVPFTELGYDSLALLETAGLVAREYGVDLPDDVVGSINSPAEFVELVNATVHNKEIFMKEM
jgi:minimal PKS acyl carrier protein